MGDILLSVSILMIYACQRFLSRRRGKSFLRSHLILRYIAYLCSLLVLNYRSLLASTAQAATCILINTPVYFLHILAEKSWAHRQKQIFSTKKSFFAGVCRCGCAG